VFPGAPEIPDYDPTHGRRTQYEVRRKPQKTELHDLDDQTEIALETTDTEESDFALSSHTSLHLRR
jgi:hypothetical protein